MDLDAIISPDLQELFCAQYGIDDLDVLKGYPDTIFGTVWVLVDSYYGHSLFDKDVKAKFTVSEIKNWVSCTTNFLDAMHWDIHRLIAQMFGQERYDDAIAEEAIRLEEQEYERMWYNYARNMGYE